MRPFRKILSVLLLLLIVPTICGQIAVQTARSLLLDPAVPERLARESGFAGEVERAVMLQVSGSLTGGATPLNLTRAEAEALVRTVLPPARIELHTAVMVGGLQRWLAGQTQRPEILIDLRAEQAALPAALIAVAEAKVATLPVCTTQEAIRYAAGPRTEMPPCRLSDPKANRAIIEYVVANAHLENYIPAQLDVAAQFGPAFWDEQPGGFQAVRLGLSLVPYGWAVTGFLLLLLALLNLDRWYTPFAWVGGALIAGGGLMLVGALGALSVALPLLLQAAGAGGFGEAIAAALVGGAAVTMRNLSAIVAAAGLASVVVAVAGSVSSGPASRDAAA